MSARAASVLRRRVVVAVLVIVSLAMLTVYFRESSTGSLHSVQSAGASVLHPFEVAANRVAQPFRDLGGWIGGLSTTRSENRKLKEQNAKYQAQLAELQVVLRENSQLRAALGYVGSNSYPQDYNDLPTSVLSQAPGQFDQRVVVGVGRNNGVRLNDPVVSTTGFLVGTVTRVFSNASQVKLITDETSFVSVLDPKTGAAGILRHNDPGSSIILDQVPKSATVNAGDRLVTAGWKQGPLTSIFPRGIPVGTVQGVNQTDIDPYKQIEVSPYVDFGNLSSMIVLVKKKAGS
ncbi:MAG TPA: rod shape-determining protein MreC [Gaiellaceae bacterium]|jgi:rod shape-determining protein MreC|nr:rod shape-determining protein MreC [Gaiellaceae bacterium]